jgi:hypothetical protein
LWVHAFEIQVELSVGVEALQFLGELQSQHSLTNPSHPLKAEDGSGAASSQGGFQSGEILGAADEVGRWGGDLVEGGDLRDYTHIGYLVSPDDITGGGDQIASRLSALDVDLASPI